MENGQKTEENGTRITLIPMGNADLSGFQKFFITQSFTKVAQRLHGEIE